MHKHISASRSTIDDSSGHGGGLEEFSPVVDMQHESSTPGLHLAHLDRHSRSRCASCSLRFLRGRATRHGTSIGPAIAASGIGPAHRRGRPAVVSHDNREPPQRRVQTESRLRDVSRVPLSTRGDELIGPLSDTTILHLIKIETTYAQVPDLGVSAEHAERPPGPPPGGPPEWGPLSSTHRHDETHTQYELRHTAAGSLLRCGRRPDVATAGSMDVPCPVARPRRNAKSSWRTSIGSADRGAPAASGRSQRVDDLPRPAWLPPPMQHPPPSARSVRRRGGRALSRTVARRGQQQRGSRSSRAEGRWLVWAKAWQSWAVVEAPWLVWLVAPRPVAGPCGWPAAESLGAVAGRQPAASASRPRLSPARSQASQEVVT